LQRVNEATGKIGRRLIHCIPSELSKVVDDVVLMGYKSTMQLMKILS
jgi:hypothetical protein